MSRKESRGTHLLNQERRKVFPPLDWYEPRQASADYYSDYTVTGLLREAGFSNTPSIQAGHLPPRAAPTVLAASVRSVVSDLENFRVYFPASQASERKARLASRMVGRE